MLQIAGGVVAAGVVAAGATAMTGSGVTWGGSNGATASQFIGGTVVQTVSGANITNVTYNRDATGAQTSSIAITLTSTVGKVVTITPAGGAWSDTTNVPADAADADEWSCTDGSTVVLHATAPAFTLATATSTITCSAADSGTGDAIQGFKRGLTGLSIQVA
ncbi:hypothetical protein [Paractinoplanes toevensis]|nr:hypothetical protein [Actinoplanes toevensis]